MAEQDIDALFAATLRGGYDDEEPWDAVRALRRMGTRLTFVRAAEWCQSDDPLRRARGANVLAQLGKTVEHRTNNFPEESYGAVVCLVEKETDPLPLLAGIHALGHLDNPEAVPLISRFHTHTNEDVRFAVACALGNYPNDPLSMSTLLQLMQDTDADVRDWATFGLGVQGICDSDEIRDALVRRLTDENTDVREEAMVGLAQRRDERVIPAILESLKRETMTVRVIEAAYLMLGMHSEREDWKAADYSAALRQRFLSL